MSTMNRRQTWWALSSTIIFRRAFRSDAALEAIAKASEDRVRNVVLYNYPSFSGAFSALFAHLYHSRLNIPCLVLPFSSVVPFRVEDLYIDGLERCYLLDFLGPKGFAAKLSQQTMCEVIGFEHRKSVLSQIPSAKDHPPKVTFHIDIEKNSANAAYEYFSSRLASVKSPDDIDCSLSIKGNATSLLNPEVRDRVELVIKYVEDVDLRRRSLPDIRAFNIGLSEWRSKLNWITNPYMYDQLMEISSEELIKNGKFHISSRQNAADKLLDKVFKVRLGRGFYGESLGVRADGNSYLSDEIGKQLSVKSAAAGLR